MIRAGQLRHRVTLQRPAAVTSPYGQVTTTWADIAEVWADFNPLSVREFIGQGTTQSQVSARVVIRYREDVNAAWRLVHRGKTYNIAGVLADPDSGREYITLPVFEVTP